MRFTFKQKLRVKEFLEQVGDVDADGFYVYRPIVSTDGAWWSDLEVATALSTEIHGITEKNVGDIRRELFGRINKPKPAPNSVEALRTDLDKLRADFDALVLALAPLRSPGPSDLATLFGVASAK